MSQTENATPLQTLLFPQLTPAQLEDAAGYGEKQTLEPGTMLFVEGKPAVACFLLLSGEVKVTKDVSGRETVITIHHAGEFTGEVSVLLRGKCIASGKALTPVEAIRLDAAALRTIIAQGSDLANVLLAAMVARPPEAQTLSNQREKMASLGVMAAGLAHELNNPASAAQRAAAQLRDVFARQQASMVALHTLQITVAQCDALTALQNRAMTRMQNTPELDPLEQSDREEKIADWLDEHQCGDGWQLAPTFVRAGITQEELAGAAESLSPESCEAAFCWLEGSLNMLGLLNEVEQAAGRVATLVKAVKSYSYMDQAPQQELDVHAGLETTLTILAHKLRHTRIEVKKDYHPNLPCITAFGSELNQVWTNLIGNAIDALGEQGTITIRTSCEGNCVLVEIGDDGPGIPPDLQTRIFEPFFTTKGVGEGTGLGLDIAYKIVVGMHGGDLRVESQPGDTRFQARLPTEGPVKKQ